VLTARDRARDETQRGSTARLAVGKSNCRTGSAGASRCPGLLTGGDGWGRESKDERL